MTHCDAAAWCGALSETQALGEAVLRAEPVCARFPDHGSDVWRVTTPTRTVAARRSTLCGRPDTPFFYALRHVFGVNPRRTRDLTALHHVVARATTLPVPRVLGFSSFPPGLHDQVHADARCGEVAWVEWMPGEPLAAFVGAPASVLRSLATHLADLHSAALPGFGSPAAATLKPLSRFHLRLARAGEALVRRHFADDVAAHMAWARARERLLHLPAPSCSALILADIDASQYLVQDGQLCALVDLEAVVWGPPAWDFVNLE
ncbi:MAG: phosphotransferase, partial [Firmicutes bacterium]|nr:phosphotransferase [Bacillota bacterium]